MSLGKLSARSRSDFYCHFLFLGIFLVSAAFRASGINWDSNQHLHPDERFLTMVANGISWPKTITGYLDTQTSPLNPHNAGFSFYVYGTFPLFLVKAIAEALDRGDYNNLTLVGRALSALFDLGTLTLVFLITKSIISKSEFLISKQIPNSKSKLGQLEIRSIRNSPYIAMFLYGAMVLPIQLSHFFTVDPYLTFFLTLSFYFLLRSFRIWNLFGHWDLRFGAWASLLGLAFGLAIASKISALLFLPVIGLAFLYWFWKNRSPVQLAFCCIIFLVTTYATVRLTDPYLFIDGNLINPTLNPAVLANWKQLKSFDGPQATFPPALQWIGTTPIIDPLKDIMVSGLGLPMGILAVMAILYQVSCVMYQVKTKTINERSASILLLLFWIFLLFGYQGIQFAKPLRYFYPVYPLLAVASGLFLSRFRVSLFLVLLALLVLLIWPLAFSSIYTRPHTRIAASEWIYTNIPQGSTLAWEYWDDPLPLCLPNAPCGQYTAFSLSLYDQDTPAKWQKINATLKQVDYIILSSNRLYGSIMRVPDRYPQTNQYYQSLFNGSLGFTKIAQFTSRPTLPIPFLSLCIPVPGNSYGIVGKSVETCTDQGVSFIDDYAEESYTTYDHPKVVIFKKNYPSVSPLKSN